MKGLTFFHKVRQRNFISLFKNLYYILISLFSKQNTRWARICLRAFGQNGTKSVTDQKSRDQRLPKGQGLLRKGGPLIFAILLPNLVLSRFTLVLKGSQRAFNKSHPSFGELSTKVSPLESFCRAFRETAFGDYDNDDDISRGCLAATGVRI